MSKLHESHQQWVIDRIKKITKSGSGDLIDLHHIYIEGDEIFDVGTIFVIDNEKYEVLYGGATYVEGAYDVTIKKADETSLNKAPNTLFLV